MELDPSLLSDTLQRFAGGSFGTIAIVTFFVCEAIFAALPIEKARMKQLTAILAGAVLGFLLRGMETMQDSIIQGLLAGGATTIIVAKFKKSSTVAPQPPPSVEKATIPMPIEPIEHI